MVLVTKPGDRVWSSDPHGGENQLSQAVLWLPKEHHDTCVLYLYPYKIQSNKRIKIGEKKNKKNEPQKCWKVSVVAPAIL